MVQLEGVFEEAEDVLVDVDREVGGEFVHFGVDFAERSAGRVNRRIAGLLWKIDVVHTSYTIIGLFPEY
jgi:hypothetical protein